MRGCHRGQALGFYIQRSEAGKPGDFSDLSDAKLKAKLKAYEAIDKASAPVTTH
jgi:hypothetical protein